MFILNCKFYSRIKQKDIFNMHSALLAVYNVVINLQTSNSSKTHEGHSGNP